MDVTLVGVPYALDRRLAAGEDTLAAFRAAGLEERLVRLTGRSPAWQTVAPELPEGTPQQRIAVLMRAVGEAVAEARVRGRFPLILGGDCMTSLGAMAGLTRETARVGILWMDSHGDFNTWETTPSGYLGGMPLAMLVGRGEQTIVRGAGVTRPVAEADVLLAGARDLDSEEDAALAASDMTYLPEVESLLTHPLLDLPLYLHLDVDVVDSSLLPAVDYPALGGPDVETVARALRHVTTLAEVRALTVAALNVAKDPQRASLATAIQLVEAAVGGMLERLAQ